MQRFQLFTTILFGLFFLGASQSTGHTATVTNTTVNGETSSDIDETTSVKNAKEETTMHISSSNIAVDKAGTTDQTPFVSTVITSDVCGLSLVSQSEQDSVRSRKCSCDAFNEEVNCKHLDISSLPKLISFPKSARDVSFAGNKIENIAEDTFYNGRYVINLDLSHNRIDFISIVAFRAFKNLKRLDLSHNKIWNIPSKSFDGLTSLKYLNLGYNEIAVLTPDLFSAIPNLVELDLESNPLIELEPKLFEHLKHLETLNLQATLLKVIPDHLFIFTPRLKVLDLSSNELRYVPKDALKFLDHLSMLKLSGNPISVINEEAFMGMRGLVLLYLDRMPLLSKIEKYAFGDLQNLQELHCSYNFLLTEIDEKAFVKKSTNTKVDLAQLFLRQDSLDTIPKNLLNWNGNVELHLTDNPIYCDCRSEWMLHLKLKNEFQNHVK